MARDAKQKPRNGKLSAAQQSTTELVKGLLNFSSAVSQLLARIVEQSKVGPSDANQRFLDTMSASVAIQYRHNGPDLSHSIGSGRWRTSRPVSITISAVEDDSRVILKNEPNDTDFADSDLLSAQSFMYSMLMDVGDKINTLSHEVIPKIIDVGMSCVKYSPCRRLTATCRHPANPRVSDDCGGQLGVRLDSGGATFECHRNHVAVFVLVSHSHESNGCGQYSVVHVLGCRGHLCDNKRVGHVLGAGNCVSMNMSSQVLSLIFDWL